MDNTAIERIATPDLTADALALLAKYETSDDAVFFLGRLVWQGQMTPCVPKLFDIACDPARGLYARIASIRGVMSVGRGEQKDLLWDTISSHPGPLDRRLLAELLERAEATTRSVELLLHTIGKLAPLERFNATGLEPAFHAFIDRLPMVADDANDQPLGDLIRGLNDFAGREPLISRSECHVSEGFAWLMAPALHAVDRLVAARSAQALSPHAIDVMRNMPALHFWQGEDLSKYGLSLGSNVPKWPELNDLLYWASIAARRANSARAEPVIDDWQIAFSGHFWGFGRDDFERCLRWVHTKEDGDDREVALSRCVNLYVQEDRPAAWLRSLLDAVRGSERLEAVLHGRLNPKPSPMFEKIESERREWERQDEDRKREEGRKRADWIRALKSDPDRVLHPTGLKPGEFSGDHYHLLMSISKQRGAVDPRDGANWQALIPEFGDVVARAYRDAAVAHWRAYQPRLRSEGADPSSTPYPLIFAMTGLAIEALEDGAFPRGLTPDDARNAFRYVTWELNGFPNWFEPLYQAFPAIGLEAVTKEVTWELERSDVAQFHHHILHDILYHAPWLHAKVAALVFSWLSANDVPSSDTLRYCLNILTGGGTALGELARLAERKVKEARPSQHQPRWFALWVDTNPDRAIPELKSILEGLPLADASIFAQQFVVGLLGDRFGFGTRASAFRNAGDLKTLYILMHRFIRIADDIERAGKGVYTPELRDDAQEARAKLFNMLAAVPGAEAYDAIKSLEEEHPEPAYRLWMARRAHERATTDADEPPWTDTQVSAFRRNIMCG